MRRITNIFQDCPKMLGQTQNHRRTAAELQQFFVGKLPKVQAFKLTDKTTPMFRADLAAAGIPYIYKAGRYVDFHSLRHTTGTLLAAAGVHPQVA